ncbi:hypothetical protein NMG60_11028563 [Bertholletia excelsa]
MAVTSAPQPDLPDQKGKISSGDTKEREQVQGQFENGKTCHQCRQRTVYFAASCKNPKKDKPCTIKFCQKCLLNRYGEKAKEMAVVEDWKCPKCRGICNCSICMKKRGLRPTGMLVHTAKATGFSSVSELLHVKGPESFGIGKIVKAEAVNSDSEPGVAVLSMHGKENSFSGVNESNLHPLPLLSSPDEKKKKKMKKMKRKHLKERQNGSQSNGQIAIGGLQDIQNGDQGDGMSSPHEKKIKKMKKMKQKHLKEMQNGNQGDGQIAKGGLQERQNGDPGDGILLKKISTKKPRISKGHSISIQDGGQDMGVVLKHTIPQEPPIPDIPLPLGTQLTNVAGIELPLEDVGLALQFLEFCAAFEEILDLKEGEPQYIVQELIRGGRGCRGRYSPVLQFHIQLLLLIEKDLGKVSPVITFKPGKNSWLHALKNCASRSQGIFEKLNLNWFSWDVDDYDSLDSSNKLRLLTFLCDEALSTAKMRSWIDNQNSKSFDKVKQAKERVTAAKVKEKQLKQKIREEVIKAIIGKNGVPLSHAEHETVVSQFKSDVAQANAEVLETARMVPADNQRSDAVRTEPLFLDKNGRTYWRLKSYEDSHVLCQDVKARDTMESGDKWFFFDDGGQKEIEKYFVSLRKRRLRSQNITGL